MTLETETPEPVVPNFISPAFTVSAVPVKSHENETAKLQLETSYVKEEEEDKSEDMVIIDDDNNTSNFHEISTVSKRSQAATAHDSKQKMVIQKASKNFKTDFQTVQTPTVSSSNISRAP